MQIPALLMAPAKRPLRLVGVDIPHPPPDLVPTPPTPHPRPGPDTPPEVAPGSPPEIEPRTPPTQPVPPGGPAAPPPWVK
ncbi:MAG: hypothetical protein Q8R98_03415 [Rubrivivax sp.]|nr:hypothetical protein [Rubrivivax sp.]